MKATSVTVQSPEPVAPGQDGLILAEVAGWCRLSWDRRVQRQERETAVILFAPAWSAASVKVTVSILGAQRNRPTRWSPARAR